MSAPHISFDSEMHLSWPGITEAIAAGHRHPKGDIQDIFLYRGKDTLLTRSAWIDGLGSLTKTATVFPDNASKGKPTIHGAVALFDDNDGTLAATLDFHLVTKWKTAGDSLTAAQRLAHKDAQSILIVGAGTVARSLVEGYHTLWPEATIRLWSRSEDARSAMQDAYPFLCPEPDLSSAVQRADIISCATGTRAPIIMGEWLRPGQHVDLIGAFRPDMREADDTAMQRARIFVDSRDTTLDHIGELKIPLADGTITPDDIIADFYELDRFRRQDDDITLFKNGGGAHLDLMTADYIRRAVA